MVVDETYLLRPSLLPSRSAVSGASGLQGDIRGRQIFGDSSQNWQHSLEYRILGASDEVRGRGLSLLGHKPS
jgi:hypothetical protein